MGKRTVFDSRCDALLALRRVFDGLVVQPANGGSMVDVASLHHRHSARGPNTGMASGQHARND